MSTIRSSIRSCRVRLVGWLAVWLSMSSVANAQTANIAEERLAIDPNTSTAATNSQIRGDEIRDYLFDATAGDQVAIGLAPSNASAYFNLLPADSDTALHIGSVHGNQFDGVLEHGGSYRIRVYLMRNAARRDESAQYSLTLAVNPAGPGEVWPPNPDFADGLTGGPDFWDVSNLSAGSRLNVRSAPGIGNAIIGQLSNGERVRNLGCAIEAGTRWCRIGTEQDPSYTGWVSGRYLRESTQTR